MHLPKILRAVALTTTLLTLAPATLASTAQTEVPAPASSSAPAPQPRRWEGVWQRWDGTAYKSRATCEARGRQILKHYKDVKKISCRQPCGKWWLYTFRDQWV